MTEEQRFGAARRILPLLDGAYALGIAGIGMVWPPGALIVAAIFLILQAVLLDRRIET